MKKEIINICDKLENLITTMQQHEDYKNGYARNINLFNNGEYFLDIFVMPDSKYVASFVIECDGEYVFSDEATSMLEIYKAFIVTYTKYIRIINR